MADLDARIILGARPLPSVGDMRDQRQQREIQQQEVELRRQEILARRDALREQARQRSMPPPVDEDKEFKLRLSKAKTLAQLLKGADADSYPVVRGIAQQLVGDDVLDDLPEEFDPVRVAALAKLGDEQIASTLKTREIRTRRPDGGESIQIVEDKPNQTFESAPEPPKPIGSTNPTEASLALAAAQGDKNAARALALIRGQRVGSGGGTAKAEAPKLSAGQQDDLATMMTVVDLIDSAESLGNKIGWKGVGGMGAGSAAGFMAKNFGAGSADEETLRNQIGNIKGTIAKLRGGTAFSAAEQAMLDSYTPGINDGDKVIQAKFKSLRDFIAKKQKNTVKVAMGDFSTGGGKSDPLGIR